VTTTSNEDTSFMTGTIINTNRFKKQE